MSSIVSAITGGQNQGMNYQAANTSLMAPVNKEQLGQAYTNTQTGLQQQQDFLNAVQAQNGLGNQSSVFNQQQAIANGTGPNPAQAMLANSTGANVSNQAALMAGQRGAGSNVGMMARQAANVGANMQQNSAGQAASLQAQQSLGALNQMGSIANQQVGQQANAANAYTNAALGQQSNLMGGANAYNQSQVGMQSNINSANAGIQGQIAKQQGDLFSGVVSGGGQALMMMADGGEIQDQSAEPQVTVDPNAPKSNVANFFKRLNPNAAPQPISAATPVTDNSSEENKAGKAMGQLAVKGAMMLMSKGGHVPALVSPGETYLDRKDVEQVKKGANPLQVGERIPGQPKVKGNSYANDTVPKDLEEGGVVIPNSIMQSKDAAEKAAKFVAAVLKKNALKKGK